MTAEVLPRDIPIIPQPIDWVPIGGIGTTPYAGPSTCSACGGDIAGDGYGYAGTRPTWTPDLALCHDCVSDLAAAFCQQTGLQVVLPSRTRIQIPLEPAAVQAPEVTVEMSFDSGRPGATFDVVLSPEPPDPGMVVATLAVARTELGYYIASYQQEMSADEPAPVPAPGALLDDVLDPRD